MLIYIWCLSVYSSNSSDISLLIYLVFIEHSVNVGIRDKKKKVMLESESK